MVLPDLLKIRENKYIKDNKGKPRKSGLFFLHLFCNLFCLKIVVSSILKVKTKTGEPQSSKVKEKLFTMINLREMKNDLDAMIEEREAMCENPDITMDEQSDMDWRIEAQYRDIADLFLNDEDIMKAAQEILDKKYMNKPTMNDLVIFQDESGECYIPSAAELDYIEARRKDKEEQETERAYIVNVKVVSLDSRDTKDDNINEDYLWNGDEAPVIGQRVFVENGNFNADAIVINVVETTMEEVEDMDLENNAYILDNAYLPVVKVTYGEDDKFEAYAVWNEPGAMEDGEWNDRDLPRAGCICALRLGYKNYVEASISSVEEVSEEEIEELKEKETVYKAYDYDRMVLQRYGFDPDEEGKPEE